MAGLREGERSGFSGATVDSLFSREEFGFEEAEVDDCVGRGIRCRRGGFESRDCSVDCGCCGVFCEGK